MKAISLYQPLASLVALGLKRFETRSWSTTYRGPLLIHAAKRWDADLKSEWAAVNELLWMEDHPPLPAELPLGCVVAVCRLADCWRVPEECVTGEEFPLVHLELAFGDFRPGRFGWTLEDVRPLPEPVPWRGMQGLWSVSEELAALCGVKLEPEVLHLFARIEASWEAHR